jgi:CRISPR-associated endoribonuclease Cas6
MLMYFIGLEVKLTANRPITFAHTRFAHAAIMKVISSNDNYRGLQIHNNASDKGMTIALLPEIGNIATLRTTFFSIDAPVISDYLVNHWFSSGAMRLGNLECHIESFQTKSQSWQRVSFWSDLLNSKPMPYLRFNFLTPTAIMKVNRLGQRYTELLPTSGDIFRSLQRKWQKFGGPRLTALDFGPDTTVTNDFSDCVVSGLKLRSEEINMGNYKLLGFCGHVVYLYRGRNQDFLKMLAVLTDFAKYSGVGYHTLQGMGAVHTESYGDGNGIHHTKNGV